MSQGIKNGRLDPARLKLRLIGSTALDGTDLPGLVRQLGLDGIIELVPRMSRRESLQEMASASALLLLQPGHPLSIPAKAYEYLALGRPVLALTDEGATADLINASGAGLVVRSSDEAGMELALQSLMNETSGCRPSARDLFDGELRAAEMRACLETLRRPSRV